MLLCEDKDPIVLGEVTYNNLLHLSILFNPEVRRYDLDNLCSTDRERDT